MAGSENSKPQSVEEAGALLGAAITRYGNASFTTTDQPKGIHSSFAVISPVPSSELLHLLHTLRHLLRNAPKNAPLVAAPSLLAGVLMKLLGTSSSLAAHISSTDDPNRPRVDVPPMLNTAIRRVWVDCVVLCHSSGQGLSGAQRINLNGFVRDMIILAGLNPRTARALGGTRIAALEVISGALEDSKLSIRLGSWTFDVTQLCQRALKSSGNGEPTYRIAAVRTACSVVVASRTAFLKTRDVWGSAQFVLKGALEDKSIFEMVKLLKIAVQDKYPEVRSAAARLACLLGPVAINMHVKSQLFPDAQATSSTTCLEEIMTLAFKNLDDESLHVSEGWAEALARCMCTSIEFRNQAIKERRYDKDGPNSSDTHDVSTVTRGKRGMLSAKICSTLPKALKYLVSVFIKVGGELAAPRAGGYFSKGGRAVRIGFARSIIHILRLQMQIKSIGEGRSISYKESILITLAMVGNDMEAQLNPIDRGAPKIKYLDATTVVTSRISFSSDSLVYSKSSTGRNLFGHGLKVSHADGCVARLLTNQVLRSGFAEFMTEITQLTLLHELIHLFVYKHNALKGNQLQVILIELSHLFFTLGEATASSLEEIVPGLFKCLRHPNHGVRYEAAATCAAVASVFPSEGRRIVREGLYNIRSEHAELISIASNGDQLSSLVEANTPRFRFGRTNPSKKNKKVDKTLKHQFAIHGLSLMVSIVVRDLPDRPGGLPMDILNTITSMCEILTSTLTKGILKEGSPSSVCTCVRAAFHLVSGALTTGPGAISNQIALIFGLWQKVYKSTKSTDNFTADHELMCLEAILTSIVTFLKFCADLLVSIPDALSQTSIILETLLPLFFGKGRLASNPINPTAACRLDSAKASIMEAFAWLPPGSFPMIADSVFGVAASHIQLAIQNDVSCSILSSLISNEDAILDAVSFARATMIGQVGGARDLESDIITLTSDIAHHGDRESAVLFLGTRYKNDKVEDQSSLGIDVLALLECEGNDKPITVLHQCGTWSRPVDPSSATRIRLIDAAVQAFASTFALRSCKEQERAMVILQSLLPPTYFQNGRNISPTDQDRIGKGNIASTTNIVSVLLSCVKAQPVDESTHDIPIGLGPSWKNKASTLLLSLLPSPVHYIRRAAAEGLAILATLGVREDMRFLQSSVFHSLDEIISNNTIQGQGRNIAQDDFQNGRSAGLLALGCIQRNTYRIIESRASRSRLRGSPVRSTDGHEDSLQIIKSMTRLLPYVSGRVTSGISLNARSSALHAILMLLKYSGKLECHNLNEENLHLLMKAVEIVEDNYLAVWTVASYVIDQGNEAQKVTFESSFLSVLLRFMSFLTPFLHHLGDSDPGISKRFSTMAIIIMECHGDHSIVHLEALAFFQVYVSNQALLPFHGGGTKYDDHPILSCFPFLMSNLSPFRSLVLSRGVHDALLGCHSSDICLRATLRVIRSLSMTRILVVDRSGMKAISLLYAALEGIIASTTYSGENLHRGLAAPRETEQRLKGLSPCGKEISDVLRYILYLERPSSRECQSILLRYILLTRSIIAGNSVSFDNEEEENNDSRYTVTRVAKSALEQAASDCRPLFDLINPPLRWQVKLVAVQMMKIALMELATKCRYDTLSLDDSLYFNPRKAQIQSSKAYKYSNAMNLNLPESIFALHTPELISCGCMVATATVGPVEMRMLQQNSMYCLDTIICSFESISNRHSHTSVLGEYIPQISSCIKSSLSALGENVDELTCRLFWAGCNTLCSFLRSRVSDDKAVLKRLLQSVLLTKEEVPFFSCDLRMPILEEATADTAEILNARTKLLVKIGKILVFENMPSENTEISQLVETENMCIGAHAAALAIDGAQLLSTFMLTLCGQPSEKTLSQAENSSIDFFSFGDVLDIDDHTKAALVKKWANNALLSFELFLNAINSGETSQSESKRCLEWLELVIPLLFRGLYDAIEKMNYKPSSQDTVAWAEEVDVYDVACCCLGGLSTLAKTSNASLFNEKWKQEIEVSTVRIYKFIFLPVLLGNVSLATGNKSGHDNECMMKIVAKSCELFKTFSTSIFVEKKSDLSPFLITLFSLLNMVGTDRVNLANNLVATIVAACFDAVAGIIRISSSPSTLAKAMLPLALSLSTQAKQALDPLYLAAQELLQDCLKHNSTTIAEVAMATARLAKHKNWTAWLSIIKINDGIAAQESMMEIEKGLLNPCSVEEQLRVLKTIRILIENTPPPNALTGRILSAVGAEILSLLEGYGTLRDRSVKLQSKRVPACADCVRIALASYQQFSVDFSDDDITEFLIMLFETFIIIVSFNGLPNHPPPNGTVSDSSIGRMCAQAVTHIARTAPVPFKTSMSGMSEDNQIFLEFVVRREMSGYAVATASAPLKKKISLKGFKRR